MADDRVTRVWIVGSSIIRRLYAHIREQGLDKHLGLRCSITWEGRGGKLWEQLLPVLRSLRAKAPAPDILVIHFGGNSLCREGRNHLDILREIKTDLAEVLRSAYGIERSRRWLNSTVAGFLAERQMHCHSNIDLSHLSRDGVHLSPEGNELLLSNLREGLQAREEEEEEESEDEGIVLDSSYEDIMENGMPERLAAAEMQITELQRQLDFSTAIYLLLLLQNQQILPSISVAMQPLKQLLYVHEGKCSSCTFLK
ncbi:hypothetical protein Q7C36_004437 [Tachysurus vachellii]|uniref:Uncharacterized protein n=1 Tax=Tachysurus vachellii TaxID=175792 RepID=A0AA88NIJ5_TACVA|nr:hypothetical protein Q7C36_004437 [Tachysurus vachellii]